MTKITSLGVHLDSTLTTILEKLGVHGHCSLFFLISVFFKFEFLIELLFEFNSSFARGLLEKTSRKACV